MWNVYIQRYNVYSFEPTFLMDFELKHEIITPISLLDNDSIYLFFSSILPSFHICPFTYHLLNLSVHSFIMHSSICPLTCHPFIYLSILSSFIYLSIDLSSIYWSIHLSISIYLLDVTIPTRTLVNIFISIHSIHEVTLDGAH